MKRSQKVILGGLTLFSGLTIGITAKIISLGTSNYHELSLPIEAQVIETTSTPPLHFLPTETIASPVRTSSPTITPTPYQPVTITPTASSTATASPTASPSSTPTLEPTSTPSVPKKVLITGIYGFPQTFNLSCESRSAVDLARYFGTSISELEFLNGLPVSDNPEKGFVGDVTGLLGQIPPNPYGVHAIPVANRLSEFGLNAIPHKGMSYSELQDEVAAGRPIIIWGISGLQNGEPIEYTASDGERTIVAPFEHTFIVIGYSDSHVTVLDNEKVYRVPTKKFLHSWKVLGNMAVTIAP